MTHWKRFARRVLVLTLATGLVACGDDDPAGPGSGGDELTEAETQLMMEALVNAGGFLVGAGGGPAGGPAAVDFGPETTACPEGGTITVEGSYDVNQQTGALTWNVIQTHDACVSSASDNSTWTFDGNPNVEVDFEAGIEGQTYSLSGTQVGGIRYSNGSKSGSCSIDISYDFTGNESTQSYTGEVSGTVCGVSYTYSTDISG